MIPKERFLAALKRQPVDRVPLFDFLFQRPLFKEVIGRAPDAYNARDAMDLTVAMGLDSIWIPYSAPTAWKAEVISDRVYKDEWGTTFEKDEAAWPLDAPMAFPIRSRKDLRHYTVPGPLADGRTNELHAAVVINQNLGDKAVAVMGSVKGPLTITWYLLGYEKICLTLYDDPEFLEELAEIAVDFALKMIPRIAATGVDAMIIANDYGASAQGLLKPAHFKATYKPVLKKMVDGIKAQELPVFFHCCGCIRDYLDDLMEIGTDALHPLQRTAGMDLAAVKAKYGSRLCIIGNVDSSRTLPFGSPGQIEAETREALRIAAPGFGYILASDHSLHDGIPVKNILWMFDCARKYGTYSGQDLAA